MIQFMRNKAGVLTPAEAEQAEALIDDILGITDKPYKELEYIQSSGTQYINTKLIPNNHWLEIKFQCNDMTNQSMFAAGTDQQKQFQLTWFNSNGYRWFYAWNGGETGIAYPSGTACTNVCVARYNKDGELRINNVLISNGLFNASATGVPLTLFRRDGVNLAKMKLFYCKLYDKSTNELVQDFIPAKDPNNIVCLFDNISKRYFYNAGTGDFVAGPIVEV